MSAYKCREVVVTIESVPSIAGGPDRPSIEPLLLSVAEAAATLGVSRDLVYELVHRGDLPCLRIGRRKVIPRRAVEQLVEHALAGFDARRTARLLSGVPEDDDGFAGRSLRPPPAPGPPVG
jgi:excisionase family DNA binding protein